MGKAQKEKKHKKEKKDKKDRKERKHKKEKKQKKVNHYSSDESSPSSNEYKRDHQLEPEAQGPGLPPEFLQNKAVVKEKETPFADDLPKQKKIVGPVRPPSPELQHLKEQQEKILQKGLDSVYEDEKEEDDVVGPKILTPEEIERLEKRRAMAMTNENGSEETMHTKKVSNRDEWMTKLPEGRNPLGALVPRQFSRKGTGSTQVDSSWAQSPSEKEQQPKVNTRDYLAKDMKEAHDKQMEEYFQQEKQKRGLSLLEMHQQQLIKKRKEDGSTPSNFPRPFDREKDILTSYVDPQKRQKMIQNAKQLDNMFEKGENKFV